MTARRWASRSSFICNEVLYRVYEPPRWPVRCVRSCRRAQLHRVTMCGLEQCNLHNFRSLSMRGASLRLLQFSSPRERPRPDDARGVCHCLSPRRSRHTDTRSYSTFDSDHRSCLLLIRPVRVGVARPRRRAASRERERESVWVCGVGRVRRGAGRSPSLCVLAFVPLASRSCQL